MEALGRFEDREKAEAAMDISGSQTLNTYSTVDRRLQLGRLELQIHALAQAIRLVAKAVDSATDSHVAAEVDQVLCDCRM